MVVNKKLRAVVVAKPAVYDMQAAIGALMALAAIAAVLAKGMV